MIGSVERYSSSVRKRRMSLFGTRTFRILLIAFILYLVVSRFIVATYRVESVSMEPQVNPADRVMVSMLAFGPRMPFSHARFPGLTLPQRGDLVMVQPPFYDDESVLIKLFQPVVSFFTLQKATLRRDLYGGRVTSYMLKRIIGIPGRPPAEQLQSLDQAQRRLGLCCRGSARARPLRRPLGAERPRGGTRRCRFPATRMSWS